MYFADNHKVQTFGYFLKSTFTSQRQREKEAADKQRAEADLRCAMCV